MSKEDGPEKEKSKNKVKNKPAFSQRLHAKIKKNKVYLQSSGREMTLISPESYYKIRQVQLKALDQQRTLTGPQDVSGKKREPIRNRFLDPKKLPGLNLKYPLFLGENGEMIAIMEADKYMLGSGASGVVFLGMDIDTGKQVAVKYQSVKSKKKRKDERVQERLEKTNQIKQEITNLEELDRLVSSIEYKDDIIVVDELAWGNNYAKTIKKLKDKTDLDTVLLKMDMAVKFLSEINDIHLKGFLHRDVKLDNMMWDNERKAAKIVDFATAIKGTHFKGGVVGSPSYLAPEGLKGTYSKATDVYACGIAMLGIFFPYYKSEILRELKEKGNSFDLIEFLKEIDPDLVKALPVEIKSVIEIMMNMIDPNPDNRPSLPDSIDLLKSLQDGLEYNQFITNQVNSHENFVILPEYIKNPKIKDYLLHASEVNNELLNRIEPLSLYLLLKEAAKTENKSIFDNLANRFGLFKLENAGFTQHILQEVSADFRKHVESKHQAHQESPSLRVAPVFAIPPITSSPLLSTSTEDMNEKSNKTPNNKNKKSSPGLTGK